jgi:predicted component of type VI protein secretion system
MDLVVEANLPAEHAQHQRRGQVAISLRESVDSLSAQQIVGVGLATLDGHENLKGCFACWRDGGHSDEPDPSA